MSNGYHRSHFDHREQPPTIVCSLLIHTYVFLQFHVRDRAATTSPDALSLLLCAYHNVNVGLFSFFLFFFSLRLFLALLWACEFWARVRAVPVVCLVLFMKKNRPVYYILTLARSERFCCKLCFAVVFQIQRFKDRLPLAQ